MKRLLSMAFFMLTFAFTTAYGAQITRFLGIPVDGSKADMIENLKQKGYTYHDAEDYFTGYYFGSPVYIFLQTVKGKVSRVVVYDIPQRNEQEIKARFNMVYDKFSNSSRYIPHQKKNARISDKEVISDQMRHHKLYKAVFKQIKEKALNPENIVKASMVPQGATTIDAEILNDDYYERSRRIHARALAHINKHVAHDTEGHENQVWFSISERFGKYALILFYDNIPNLLDGSKRTFN